MPRPRIPRVRRARAARGLTPPAGPAVANLRASPPLPAMARRLALPQARGCVAFVFALSSLTLLLGGLGGLAQGAADAPAAEPDLAVALTGPAAVAPGGTLRYQVTVTNTGEAAASDVVVTGTLPAPLGLRGEPDGARVVAPRVLRWALGALAAGGARRLELSATVPITASLGAVLQSQVMARTALTETVLANNGAAWATTLRPTDLRLMFETAADPVRPGELMTHTLTLANASAQTAEGLVITATLAPGTAWVRDSAEAAPKGFARTLVPGGVRWALAEADGVETRHIDLVTRVARDLPPGSSLTHGAVVRSTTLDDRLDDNAQTARPRLVVVPDLWLGLRGPALAAPGSAVEYTLTYGNRGGGTSPRPRITDTLPAGMTYLSSSPPATLRDARTLVWDAGPVPLGFQSEISVRAQVPATQTAGTELVHHAVIAAPEPDLDPADNSTSATTLIVPGPPAVLDLDAPAEVPAGDGVVQVRAEVRDMAGNPVLDGKSVRLAVTRGQLSADRVETRGGQVAVDWRPGKAAGTATLTAQVDNVGAQREVLVAPGPPARLEIVPSPAAPTAGQAVDLAVTVWDVYDNPVRDGTPVGFDTTQGMVEPGDALTVAGRAAARWQNTRAGRFALSVSAGPASEPLWLTFRPGAAVLVRLSLQKAKIPVEGGKTLVWANVDDRYGNPVEDGLLVSFSGEGGQFDRRTATTIAGLAETSFSAGDEPGRFLLTAKAASLSGMLSVEVVAGDLALSSRLAGPRGRVPGSQIQPGDKVTYTLEVSNNGPATARNVVLGAALEKRVRYSSFSASHPQVIPTDNYKPGLFIGPSDGYDRRAWSLPDLPPREVLTLTVLARVDRQAEPAWTGFDTVFFRSAITTTTAEASVADLVRTEKSDIHAADLFIQVDLDSQNSSIRPGGALIYDISFANAEAAEVPQAIIAGTVPEWTTFDHWQPNQTEGLRELEPFGAQSRLLRWAFGGPWRQNHSLRVWLDIAPDAPPEAVLEFAAEISSPVYDVDPDSNVAVSTAAQLKGVNLRAGAGGPATVGPGDTLAWQFTVHNATLRDSAPDVVVAASLPAGLTVARADPPPALQSDGALRWTLEQPLAAGAERRFAVDLAIPLDARPGTEYRGGVDVSSSQRDAFTGDNRASLVTRVVPGLAAALELSADASQVRACTDDSALITALVRDRAGNAVADGSRVRWETSAGTLSQAETPTSGGKAAVRLAAAAAAGTARLRARADAVEMTLDIAMPAGAPGRLTVAAQPATIAWDGATEVTVAVSDACGNPVADRSPIMLAAERGEWPDGSPTLALPTDSGRIAATLRVGRIAGPLRITAADGATGGTATGETTVIVAERPPPPSRWTLHLPWAFQRLARRR